MVKSVIINGDEWRYLEEFPQYRINWDGEIKNGVNCNHSLRPKPGKISGELMVTLRKGTEKHNVFVEDLIKKAFPEKENADMNDLKMPHRGLEGFPEYIIYPNGSIRHMRSGEYVETTQQDGIHKVQLRKGQETFTRPVHKLLRTAFPEMFVSAAAFKMSHNAMQQMVMS